MPGRRRRGRRRPAIPKARLGDRVGPDENRRVPMSSVGSVSWPAIPRAVTRQLHAEPSHRRWLAASVAAAAPNHVAAPAPESPLRAAAPALGPHRSTARIQVAAQRVPLWASESASARRPARERCRAATAASLTPRRCGAGSAARVDRCPAGAACRPHRRRRRSLHRTQSGPLDRINAWAAAGALSRQFGSTR